jgi:LPS export ABC transporter protein LptC
VVLNLSRLWGWLFCGIFLVACSSPATNTPAVKDPENKLTINNFIIEQSDATGKLWWRLKAKQAVYTLDKKVAQVTDLSGDLYQDNQVVLKLTAKTADVEQDGQKILLRGDVTAKETRNSLVVLSQELEWRPTEDLLTIRKNVRVSHPKVQAQSDSGKYVSRQQRLEMFDRIVATAPEQNVRLQTNYLQWQVDTQKITSNQPVQVERYREQRLIEQVNANQLVYNLEQQTVQLSDQVKFNSLDQKAQVQANSALWNINQQVIDLKDQIRFQAVQPPLMVVAGSARWQIPQKLITAANALQITQQQEQATFTANSGEIDLGKNVATLTGNAQGVAKRNQAKLQADRITWQIDNQQVVGNGHVRYQQRNPILSLTGERGVGKLQDQAVVITGSKQQLVETQIFPSEASSTP